MNAIRRKRRVVTKRRLAWVALFALLALPTYIVSNRIGNGDAADILRDYLEAVAAGDIEEALTYVDFRVVEDPPPSEDYDANTAWLEERADLLSTSPGPVYTESETSLLRAEAIDTEWRVADIDVTEDNSEYGIIPSTVRVTIAHPTGTATGVFEVDTHRRKVENGLVHVDFASSARTFVGVNGLTVDADPLRSTRYSGYMLFPGVYRFPGAPDPVAILSDPEQPIPAPELVLDEALRAEVQTALEVYIDECTFEQVAIPPNCPFGTDGEVDSDAHGRVHARDEDAYSWETTAYPQAQLRLGTTYSEDGPAILIDLADPGLIELSGTGEDQQDNLVDYTARCHFDTGFLRAYVNADGTAEVAWDSASTRIENYPYNFDTCRGTA